MDVFAAGAAAANVAMLAPVAERSGGLLMLQEGARLLQKVSRDQCDTSPALDAEGSMPVAGIVKLPHIVMHPIGTQIELEGSSQLPMAVPNDAAALQRLLDCWPRLL